LLAQPRTNIFFPRRETPNPWISEWLLFVGR
jgi:hypothetical protein